jgi:peptide deformylase
MAILPILVYGDPRLEAANQPVEDFGEELQSLIEDLFETGWEAPGLGLAAPQVGINLRIATVDLSVGKDPEARVVLANPEIIFCRGKASLEEGCLSFPGLFTTIERPTALRVRAQDNGGRWREFEADGVLIVHHLRSMKRRLFMRRVEKMRKLGVWQSTA